MQRKILLQELTENKNSLEKYLQSIYKTDIVVLEIQELTGPRVKTKETCYGIPLLIHVDVAGMRDQLVLHTTRPDKDGHERRSDRTRNIILDFETFNRLDRHVPALGMGALTHSGELQPLMDTKEFFLITRFTPGRVFAEDLKNLRTADQLLPEDRQRVLALARYLAEIHASKNEQPSLYRRCIRDLLGHGEGIMSLIDSYPPDFAIAPASRMQAIERSLIDWRWRLKRRHNRLSQVHGDFHPWNILFQADGEFAVLDRSRGEWGEPADDVSAMSINFIFFSLQQHGSLRGVFRVLFDIFWEDYLQRTRDVELGRVIQPFYAWRALVLAHPGWYPNLRDETREKLFAFIENILAEDWFDPQAINRYLESKPS
jgi:hypothetical protein